jgi:hypothetical protein
MKYLKTLDFTAQSIAWLVVLVGGLGILTTDKRGDIVVLALVCQFVIGCWQMVSSITVLILKADVLHLRKIHFIAALIDLLVLGVFAGLENSMKTSFSTFMLIATGIFIPWCLAIFYYYITWQWMFPGKSGKFLPHINF